MHPNGFRMSRNIYTPSRSSYCSGIFTILVCLFPNVYLGSGIGFSALFGFGKSFSVVEVIVVFEHKILDEKNRSLYSIMEYVCSFPLKMYDLSNKKMANSLHVVLHSGFLSKII